MGSLPCPVDEAVNGGTDVTDPVDLFEEQLERVRLLYGDDKLLQAHRIVDTLEQSMARYEGQEEEYTRLQAVWDRHTPVIEDVRREYDDVNTLLKDIQSQEGWNVMRESNGVRTLYRKEPDTPLHSVRMEGVIEANIFHVLALFYEIDLFDSWIPGLKISECLKALSQRRTKMVFHLHMWIPWPLDDRQIVAYAHGINALEDDAIFVVIRSVDEFPGVEVPEVPQMTTRVDIKFGGILIRPISETETFVSILNNSDPHLPFVPSWMINLFVERVAHLTIEKLRKQACSLSGTEHERRIQENREVYGYFEKDLEEFFARKRASSPDAPIE